MRAKLLVGKLDLDGLIGTFELNCWCHRLVRRACARRLIGFIHKNNQSTNGGASPTALLRLSAATWDDLRIGPDSEDAQAALFGRICRSTQSTADQLRNDLAQLFAGSLCLRL